METPVETVSVAPATSAPASNVAPSVASVVAGIVAGGGEPPKVAAPAKKQRVRAKSAKKVAKSASPKKKATKKVVAKAKGPKKSDIVRDLLADKATKKMPRGELLALIAKKAKLSAAAANTYLYKYAP